MSITYAQKQFLGIYGIASPRFKWNHRCRNVWHCDTHYIVQIVLHGRNWRSGPLTQHSLLRFLADLYSFRYTISSIPPSRRRYSSQTRRLKNLRRRSSPWDQENSSQGKSKVIQAIRRAKWSIKSQFCFCNRATIYNYQYFRAIFCFRRLWSVQWVWMEWVSEVSEPEKGNDSACKLL